MRDDLREPTERSGFESPAGGCESAYRSVAALAADIGLSERSTRSALRRGEIPHIRIGRRFILPKTAIAEWLRTAGRTIEAEPIASSAHSEVTVMRRNKLTEQVPE
jgi:excisionase family DNA binding protein